MVVSVVLPYEHLHLPILVILLNLIFQHLNHLLLKLQFCSLCPPMSMRINITLQSLMTRYEVFCRLKLRIKYEIIKEKTTQLKYEMGRFNITNNKIFLNCDYKR